MLTELMSPQPVEPVLCAPPTSVRDLPNQPIRVQPASPASRHRLFEKLGSSIALGRYKEALVTLFLVAFETPFLVIFYRTGHIKGNNRLGQTADAIFVEA